MRNPFQNGRNVCTLHDSHALSLRLLFIETLIIDETVHNQSLTRVARVLAFTFACLQSLKEVKCDLLAYTIIPSTFIRITTANSLCRYRAFFMVQFTGSLVKLVATEYIGETGEPLYIRVEKHLRGLHIKDDM
ncbi:hypothetical protein KIN20_007410 [Parelaphostrongylus tenuis]|uniref:Uncharacterized protein n=1 Tax=Parelaphostrongylus tenuis TaxID=148309 RepID=A0AAD5QJ60_PARTN|nr:hypothetical protein KIN20_007410 [Parelaphostrongylus tenuis]